MPTSMAHLRKRYMKQPEGFEVGGPDHVCELIKLLYGLKLAGSLKPNPSLCDLHHGLPAHPI
jgi:hypothetical protein